MTIKNIDLNWKDPFIEKIVDLSWGMDEYDKDYIDTDSIEITDSETGKDLMPFFERLNKIVVVCLWSKIKEEMYIRS